jgi:hypothetical protein
VLLQSRGAGVLPWSLIVLLCPRCGWRGGRARTAFRGPVLSRTRLFDESGNEGGGFDAQSALKRRLQIINGLGRQADCRSMQVATFDAMQAPAPTLSIKQVLFCGAMIVTLSMGIRHGFGLWLQPITQAQDWTRQTFSFALAIQNLSWGIFGVFAGMLADRFGAFRVLIGGSVLYALGLFGMAHSPTPLLFTLSAGVLIGAAQAGSTYAVIYGVIGRQIPAERRSWAMGVAAAAGSFGQFLMAPIEGQLIGAWAGRRHWPSWRCWCSSSFRWPSACANPGRRRWPGTASSRCCRRWARPFATRASGC